MLQLMQQSSAIDALTVSAALDNKKISPAYVASLLDEAPDIGNVQAHAEIVKEKSTLRRVIQASQVAIREGMAGKSAQDVLGNLTDRVFSIAEGAIEGGFRPLGGITEANLAVIDAAQDSQSLIGIPTGFKIMDEMTSGLQPSNLIIVAARPSIGKTALALNIAQHAALKAKKSVGFFSLEMSQEEVGHRVLCSEADVDSKRVRDGYASQEALKRLVLAQMAIAEAKFYVDDSALISVPEIRAKAQRLKREHGLDIIFVDYLQLMAGHGQAESRNYEVAAITRGLKLLAKELRIPVVALSQLSRGPEIRGGGKPQLADLRDSGAIEQDADVVMFLYRKDFYDNDPSRRGMTDVIMAKQRNGPVGEFPLFFHTDRVTFVDPGPSGH